MRTLIAVLSHPAAAYALVVTAVAAFVYGWYARSFVSGCAASAAALLATLGFVYVPPDGCGLLLLALGVGLLKWEFSFPTYGAALLAGLALGVFGSWLLLATGPDPRTALTAPARIVLALLGTLVLLAAVLRGWRLATLSLR
jgi:membrane-bound ClpP family serine protease